MSTPKIFLHLGAHRTGSSSFQMFLGHNRARLEQAGFNLIYPNRDGAAGGYSQRIELPSPSIARRNHKPYFRTFIKPMRVRFQELMSPDRASTILSEENILGRMGMLFLGRFYPQAGLRLDLVKRGFNHPFENVLLVVRDYGEIYSSAAAMLAQIRERPPFEKLVENIMGNQDGWPDLVSRLLAQDVTKQLTIVPYSQRGDDTNLLKLLCGQNSERLELAPKRPNISPSAKAVSELQKRFIAGEMLTVEQRQNIVNEHALSKGNAPYDPFTQDQRQALTQRYQDDLQILSNRPDVRFISP